VSGVKLRSVYIERALLTDLGLVQGGEETELPDGEPSDESTSQHHPSVHGRGLENTTQDEPESSDKDYQGRNIPVNFRLFPGGARGQAKVMTHWQSFG
jgi:hypothetical protein